MRGASEFFESGFSLLGILVQSEREDERCADKGVRGVIKVREVSVNPSDRIPFGSALGRRAR